MHGISLIAGVLSIFCFLAILNFLFIFFAHFLKLGLLLFDFKRAYHVIDSNTLANPQANKLFL